jgi:hypothetical protein
MTWRHELRLRPIMQIDVQHTHPVRGARPLPATRLLLRASRRAGEHHAVVRQAEYLDNAVGSRSVDDEMPRFRDAIAALNQAPRQTKMVAACCGDPGNRA